MRWYNTTAALRPTTRRDYRKLLDQQILPAFERASLAGIDTLSRSGVAGRFDRWWPRAEAAGKALAVLSQAEDFADAIGPRWARLIRFGADSGLRPSGLTALRVARLDLLRGTVRVVEAATEVDGHLHWGPVKTHEARTEAQLGHATASITLDTYGHLFPSELEALTDRLEQVRTAALANRERTQRRPALVDLAETAGS